LSSSRRTDSARRGDHAAHPVVLPPVGVGPGHQPLAQACTTLRLQRRQILLFARIAAQVVQLLGAFAQIEDVLPVLFADGQREMIFGDVEVDLSRRVVSKKNEETKLTRAEYNLLTYFLHNPDRVLSRDMILNSVWGYESFPNTRTVDAHVVRLRQKLEADSTMPRHFVTVHGVGYRFLL
jgi:DNA-binding response OmpR family regulator